MQDTRQDLAGYLTGLELTLKVRQDYNEKALDLWADANHYRVTLSKDGRRMSFWYYQGYGVKSDPDLAGVVETLASDRWYGLQTLDDFAYDFGWNKDTIKTYRQIVSLNRRYERVVGSKELLDKIDEIINA